MLNHNCSYEVKRETPALHIFQFLMEDVASSFRPLSAFLCIWKSVASVCACGRVRML